MPYYVALLEGASPSEARPILASEDPRVVRAVLRALGKRLGLELPAGRRGPARKQPARPGT